MDMTSPKKSPRASTIQNLGDEVSRNEAEISQPRPADHSEPNTASLHIRPSLKRRNSESPTPQPRAVRPRHRTIPRKSRRPIPAPQTGTVADNVEDGNADHDDPASEQRHLLDENAATLSRFAGPQTPPNRPRLLTENGLVTSLPVLEDSPLDQGIRERRSESSKEGMGFGDWLPGHGPRHIYQEDSPSGRRIREPPSGPPTEDVRFGDWLPSHGPQANDSSSRAPGHDRQEGESVGSSSQPPRPWEL